MKREVLVRAAAVGLLALCAGAPAGAATQAQIDQAIQDGLAWLATQQQTNGQFGSSYALANTATAVLAFENEGHFPGGGTLYSGVVERGLDYIFSTCRTYPIGLQTHGNPDSNGNGLGVYFPQSSYMYETGLVMQAIVASNTPDRVVSGGLCGGRTYANVMTDVVDFVAFAQIDSNVGRGGWRYDLYNNAGGYGDNSVAQWPVLGLVAAEQWGIHAPQWVKDEMQVWVSYIQNSNGGSGYESPNSLVNVSKTGGLLVEFFYLGDGQTVDRAARAVAYINNNWNQPAANTWDGNKGHPYAMFSVFKGLELMQVTSMSYAPASPDTPAGDWWGDYAHYLVTSQVHPATGQGYWSGYTVWGPHLATPWYIVILQATVFPVSVDVVVPGVACDQLGYEVEVHYGVERFTANGTLKLYRDGELYATETLTDFMGNATATYNRAPEDLGPHTWKAVLEVTGGGISTRAEDTDTTTVYATPQVAGIPDQVAPFTTFDLDDFQTCACDSVDWSASGVPDGWMVAIDVDHVVTVAAPAGVVTPAEITFKAVFHWPGIDCEGADSAVFSPNRPPVAHPGKIYPEEKYHVDEGGSVGLDGTQSYDPDGHAIASWDWDLDDNGTFETPGATPTFSAAGKDGPSEIYVHLRVCDAYGACGIGLAEVEILNVAPTVGPISAPSDPVPVGVQVALSAPFTDPGTPDTHVASFDWGDGTVDPPVAATSPAAGSHAYTEPGIYTVKVTVTDDDGGAGEAVFQYVVVYDPAAGFVTGGGFIVSQAGWCRLDDLCAGAEGKANFGFVSKYKRGATVPTGSTEFNFSAGRLNFHSSVYDWLVVTGSNYARFKGSGTINGAHAPDGRPFKFLVWAGDRVPDTFRIRIWWENALGGEVLVYDNGFDQAIAGGSIQIHAAR